MPGGWRGEQRRFGCQTRKSSTMPRAAWLLLLLGIVTNTSPAPGVIQRHPPDTLARVYAKLTCAPACFMSRITTVQTTVSGLVPGARYNVVYGMLHGSDIVHVSAEQLERSSTHEPTYSVRLLLDLPPLQAGSYSFCVVVYDPFPGLPDEDAFLTQSIIAITIRGHEDQVGDESFGAAQFESGQGRTELSTSSASACKHLDEHTVSRRLQIPLRRLDQMMNIDGAKLWERFLFIASDFTLGEQCISQREAEGEWHEAKTAWAHWLPTSYAGLGASALVHNLPHVNKSFADGEIEMDDREETCDDLDGSRSGHEEPEGSITANRCDDKIWDTPVAVMSQPHDTARQASTFALLRELGFRNATLAPTIKWTEIDVDGMTAEGLLSPQLFERMAKRKHETTHQGQIRYTANALSQAQRIRAAAEAGEPVIIMEDDLMAGAAAVSQVRRRLCTALSNLPPSADMVYLEYCLESCVDVRYNAQYPGLGKASYPSCAAAILFTAKGARRVSQLCLPVFDVVDRMYPLIIHTGWVDAYLLTPAVLYQDAIHRSNWAETNSYWLQATRARVDSLHRVRADAPLCWEVNVLRNGGIVQEAEGALSLSSDDAKCDRRQAGLLLDRQQVAPLLALLEGSRLSWPSSADCLLGRPRGGGMDEGGESVHTGSKVGAESNRLIFHGVNSDRVWLPMPIPEACGPACSPDAEGEIIYTTRSKGDGALEHRVGRWQLGSACAVLLEIPPDSACYDLGKGQMCRIKAQVASRLRSDEGFGGIGNSQEQLEKFEATVETLEFDVPLIRVRLGRDRRQSRSQTGAGAGAGTDMSSSQSAAELQEGLPEVSSGHDLARRSPPAPQLLSSIAPEAQPRGSTSSSNRYPDQHPTSEDQVLALSLESDMLQELRSIGNSSSRADMWKLLERLKLMAGPGRDAQQSSGSSSTPSVRPSSPPASPDPQSAPPPPPPWQDREEMACNREMMENSAGKEGGIRDGVTLAAVATLDRCLTALYSTAHWDGAVSLAFYARNGLEGVAIKAFVAESWAPFCRKGGRACSAVMLSNCSNMRTPSTVLPINLLRRAAVALAGTDLVFYADIDFIPSTGAAGMIRQHFWRVRDSMQLLVLPCFWAMPNVSWEPVLSAGPGGEVSVFVEDLCKSRLMQSLNAGEISPSFSTLQSLGHSHGPSNYPTWLTLEHSDPPYHVEYTLWYEPYFAVNLSAWRGIHGRRLFSDLFDFGGGDKAQLSMEAAMLGYKFLVHPGAFILHLPAGFWRDGSVPFELLPNVFTQAQALSRYNRHSEGGAERPQRIFKAPSGLIMDTVVDFLALMPDWHTGSYLAPGPVCYPLPLAAFRQIAPAHAQALLEDSFEASTRRITSSLQMYHSSGGRGRAAGWQMDPPERCLTKGVGSCSENIANHARCGGEIGGLPASQALSCAYWKACLGAFPFEGTYVQGSWSPTRGSGGVWVDRRLLEGWVPYPASNCSPTKGSSVSGVLNQSPAMGDASKVQFQHELMHSKYGSDGTVNTITLEVLEDERPAEVVFKREIAAVVLSLVIGAGMLHSQPAGQEGGGGQREANSRRRNVLDERRNVTVGTHLGLRCKLLTSVLTTDGALLMRVQRHLFVSVPGGCQEGSHDGCFFVPPALSAYCEQVYHHSCPPSSGLRARKAQTMDDLGHERDARYKEDLLDCVNDRTSTQERGEGIEEDQLSETEETAEKQHKQGPQPATLPAQRPHPMDMLAAALLKEACELRCLAGASILVSSTVSGLVPGASYDILFKVLHGIDPVHVTMEHTSAALEMSHAYSVQHTFEIPPLEAGHYSVAVSVYDAFPGLDADEAFLAKCVIALQTFVS